MPAPFSWTSPSPGRTQDAGDRLGRLARPGLFLALFGSLGAGKTAFVQGVARGLAVDDWDLVASPTFTLAARYEGRLPLLHVDAYRLAGPADLIDLGIEAWIAEEGVTALEWAERAGDALPPDRLDVHFAHRGEQVRELSFTARGPLGAEILEGVRQGLGEAFGAEETST